MRISIACLLFVLGLFSLVFGGCKETAFTDDPEFKTAYATRIAQRDIALTNERVAEIVAFKNIEIRNRMAGYLVQVNVDEGEYVSQGELMFAFNAEEALVTLNKEIANLKSTQAEQQVARLEVSQLETLVNKGIMSKSQVEIARAKLNALDARVSAIEQSVALAKLNASYADIHAPFTGIVDRIPYKSGSYLNSGTLLTRLSDIHKVYVYFYVSEGEYLKIFRQNKGKGRAFDSSTKIGLRLSDGSLYKYSGTIQTVASSVENNTGQIAVRAIFPNPERILKHGASAKVVLPINLSHALLIPNKSVLDIQSKKYVYLLQKDGSVKMQPFSYSYRYQDYFIADEGLDEGDSIIYEGLHQIKADSKIKPIWLSADSIWNNH